MQLKDLVLPSFVRTWDTFSVAMLAVNGVMLRRKGPHQTKLVCVIVHIHSFRTYNDLIEYNLVGEHESPIAALLSFHFKAQSWRHYNYWTVHELSDV